MPLLKAQWFHILLALSDGQKHGAGIMEEVLARTDGAMRLWPATLYGSLRDLEESGFIREVQPEDEPTEPGGRRRYHELTPAGEEVLRAELRRLRDILRVARERDLLPGPEGSRA